MATRIRLIASFFYPRSLLSKTGFANSVLDSISDLTTGVRSGFLSVKQPLDAGFGDS
jgi:hypothetical protein